MLFWCFLLFTNVKLSLTCSPYKTSCYSKCISLIRESKEIEMLILFIPKGHMSLWLSYVIFFLLFEFGNPRGKTVYKQGTTSQQCRVQSQKSSVSRKAINTLLTSSSFQRSGPMGEKLTGFVRLKYSLVRKWSWDLWYRVVNLLRIYCRDFLCCFRFDKNSYIFMMSGGGFILQTSEECLPHCVAFSRPQVLVGE